MTKLPETAFSRSASLPLAREKGVQTIAGSRVVARNALWNLIGRAAPMAITFLLIPTLVHQFGPSRWGIFTIALSLVGMMGMFDFGVGRALTRSVAVGLSSGEDAETAPSVMTGIVVLTLLGVFASVLFASLLDYWMRAALQVPHEMQTEVRIALYILCVAAPLILLNGALFSVLAAYQRLREVNLLNIPLAIMCYAGPLIVFYFWRSLVGVMLVLIALRVIMIFGYWRLCLQCMPALRSAKPAFKELKPIFKISGWMTVSNLTWPLVTYIDRFVIASFISAAATGYYATPGELVAKAYALPVAIMASAFPAIAASSSVDPENTASIFRRSILSVASALFPVALLVVTFGEPILRLWLGTNFAAHSALVFRWFGIGMLAACCDNVAMTLLDAIGLPKVNAMLSICELLAYIPLLAVLVKTYGIEGAAIAWAVRMMLDFLVRFFLVSRLYPAAASAALKGTSLVLGGTGLLLLPLLAPAVPSKIFASMISLLCYGCTLWFGAMSTGERSFVRDRMTGFRVQTQRLIFPLAKSAP